MNHKEFENLIDELEEDSLDTLKKKNSKYAPCDDALRNFHVGASIMGVTTGECVWGYATKHISSLRDRIQRNDWNDLEDVKEKIQDTINYLRFLWCVANEETNNINKTEEDNCSNCKFSYLTFDDDNWDNKLERIVVDPCLSCNRNYMPNTPEWKSAKDNYERKLC